jgi:hypothetical protein
MSRVISLSDLLLCSELSHIKNEIELLSLQNDALMESILGHIGFDTEYPVSYVPVKHRNMQNQVIVGFMAVGEIDMNRSFIDSPICTLTERMIAAAYTDPSLTRELSSLMGMRVNFRSLLENGTDSSNEDLPEDMLEPDREYVTNQIKTLESLRDRIRGDMFNDRGEAKTFEEYRDAR